MVTGPYWAAFQLQFQLHLALMSTSISDTSPNVGHPQQIATALFLGRVTGEGRSGMARYLVCCGQALLHQIAASLRPIAKTLKGLGTRMSAQKMRDEAYRAVEDQALRQT